MKIVGVAEGDHVLVMASRDEIAQVMGYSSVYAEVKGEDDGAGTIRERIGSKIVVGAEVEVSKIFTMLDGLRRHRRELGRLAGELRTFADRLDTQHPIVEGLIDEILGTK